MFNPEKLDWFSAQHILAMPAEELARRIEPLLREAGWWREEWNEEAGAGLAGETHRSHQGRGRRQKRGGRTRKRSANGCAERSIFSSRARVG